MRKAKVRPFAILTLILTAIIILTNILRDRTSIEYFSKQYNVQLIDFAELIKEDVMDVNCEAEYSKDEFDNRVFIFATIGGYNYDDSHFLIGVDFEILSEPMDYFQIYSIEFEKSKLFIETTQYTCKVGSDQKTLNKIYQALSETELV